MQDEWYRSSELDTQNEHGVRIVQLCLTGIGCFEFFLHVSQSYPISCPETISILDCLLELVLSTVKFSGVLAGGWSCRR
jgi:hypothetical protein